MASSVASLAGGLSEEARKALRTAATSAVPTTSYTNPKVNETTATDWYNPNPENWSKSASNEWAGNLQPNRIPPLFTSPKVNQTTATTYTSPKPMSAIVSRAVTGPVGTVGVRTDGPWIDSAKNPFATKPADTLQKWYSNPKVNEAVATSWYNPSPTDWSGGATDQWARPRGAASAPAMPTDKAKAASRTVSPGIANRLTGRTLSKPLYANENPDASQRWALDKGWNDSLYGAGEDGYDPEWGWPIDPKSIAEPKIPRLVSESWASRGAAGTPGQGNSAPARPREDPDPYLELINRIYPRPNGQTPPAAPTMPAAAPTMPAAAPTMPAAAPTMPAAAPSMPAPMIGSAWHGVYPDDPAGAMPSMPGGGGIAPGFIGHTEPSNPDFNKPTGDPTAPSVPGQTPPPATTPTPTPQGGGSPAPSTTPPWWMQGGTPSFPGHGGTATPPAGGGHHWPGYGGSPGSATGGTPHGDGKSWFQRIAEWMSQHHGGGEHHAGRGHHGHSHSGHGGGDGGTTPPTPSPTPTPTPTPVPPAPPVIEAPASIPPPVALPPPVLPPPPVPVPVPVPQPDPNGPHIYWWEY